MAVQTPQRELEVEVVKVDEVSVRDTREGVPVGPGLGAGGGRSQTPGGPSARLVIMALASIIAILVGVLVVVATRSSKDTAATPAPAAVPPAFGTITAFTPANAAYGLTDAVTAPDGSIYFAARGATNSIGRLSGDGQLTLLKVPGTDVGQVIVAPDGTIWTSTVKDNASSIVKMAKDGSNVQLFQIPAVDLGTVMGKRTVFPVQALTLAPDGNVWFERGQINRWDTVGGYSSAIGRLGPTGKMDVYPISDRLYAPGGIVTGPNGNIWYSATCVCARNGFIEVLPANPTLDSTGKAVLAGKYAAPTTATGATGIGPHPSRLIVVGTTLWFVEQQDDYATELVPAADLTSNGAVGKIPMGAPSSQAIVEYKLPTSHSRPTGITLGGDGNLWVTESGIGKLARMSTSGVLLGEYSVSGAPDDIVTGPDGNVYYTDGGAVDWTIQSHTDGLTGNQFPSFSPYPNKLEKFLVKGNE